MTVIECLTPSHASLSPGLLSSCPFAIRSSMFPGQDKMAIQKFQILPQTSSSPIVCHLPRRHPSFLSVPHHLALTFSASSPVNSETNSLPPSPTQTAVPPLTQQPPPCFRCHRLISDQVLWLPMVPKNPVSRITVRSCTTWLHLLLYRPAQQASTACLLSVPEHPKLLST